MKRGREEKVSLNIGKNGITDTVIDEIKAQIKLLGSVKVRANPSAYAGVDRKEFFKDLAEKTGLRLVNVRGHTGILEKR